MKQLSNMSRKTVIFAFLLFFVFDACVTLAEEKIRDETTHAKVDAMFGNWRAITPEILRAPENAAVIEELKRIADRSPASIAVVLLLRQGDEQTVQRSLAQVRAESPRDRDSAARDLSSAANPSIIRLLERDLNKEESPKWIRFEDVVILPPSMAAASIIKATILESPVFSPSVKEWARSLPQVSAGLRDGVRVWWKVNKEAVERGDYQSVVPVEVVTDTLTVLPDVQQHQRNPRPSQLRRG